MCFEKNHLPLPRKTLSLTGTLAVLVGLFALGCGGDGGGEESAAPRSSSSAEEPAKTGAGGTAPDGSAGAAETSPGSESDGHAPAGFVPGSYDDWCGGHGVPESVCTRCNRSLIPAFQAVGDWCAEHGLPESQCLACNPELVIERPPRPEGE